MKKEKTPVWKSPSEPNKYRVNELYNRFRSIMLEMSGFVINEPNYGASKEARKLENEITEDFFKLQKKYMRRES